MTGDLEREPVEGAVTLSDLANELDSTEGEESEQAEGEEGEEETQGDEAESEESEEDEGSEEEEDEEQEEPTLVLKHDGKEVTLKQSEVITLAQQGFDYSKKTMAVAEERKAVDAERAQAEQLRQTWQESAREAEARLTAYTEFLQADLGNPPDVALAAQDAAYYLAQKEQHESKKGKLQAAYAQVKHLQEEQARQRQAWIDGEAKAAEAVLRDTLPGWNQEMLNDLAGYADKLGLSPQSVELAVLKPGFWQALKKAKDYDALQEQKAKLKPKSQLPKVHKPSATNLPNRSDLKRKDAEKAYAQKPSLNTLASLIE